MITSFTSDRAVPDNLWGDSARESDKYDKEAKYLISAESPKCRGDENANRNPSGIGAVTGAPVIPITVVTMKVLGVD